MVSGEYLVVAEDSIQSGGVIPTSFPSLNNSEDDIYLFDLTGRLIDHVHYSAAWGGGDGYSLERITAHLDSNLPENWGTSTSPSGGTPGTVNSLHVDDLTTPAAVSIQPNPFSPDGDGRDDYCLITYRLPFTFAYLQAVIYDSRGREVVYLHQGEPVGMEGVLQWDGRRKNGTKARVGQYLLVLNASSPSKQTWKTVQRIILARN